MRKFIKHSKNKNVSIKNKNKVYDKRYIVTSQTAYHIKKLALELNLTEGRVIDNIMRIYLADTGNSKLNEDY